MARRRSRERDAHAGSLQELRIVEARAEPVEVVGRLLSGFEDHRHVGRRELAPRRPRLRRRPRSRASCRALSRIAHDLRGCRRRDRPRTRRARRRDKPSAPRGPRAGAGRLRPSVRGSRTSRIAWSNSMYCAARLPPEPSIASLPQFTNSVLLPSSAASKRPSSVTAAPWPAIEAVVARSARASSRSRPRCARPAAATERGLNAGVTSNSGRHVCCQAGAVSSSSESTVDASWRDFLEAELREAAEEAGRQRRGRSLRRSSRPRAPRGPLPTAAMLPSCDEDVGVLERAGGRRPCARARRGSARPARWRRRRQQRCERRRRRCAALFTAEKSDRGLAAGFARS